MKKTRRGGRPKGARPPLRAIAVRVDDATLEALEKLKAACPPGTIHPQSMAIRRALLEAAQRLDADKVQP